MDESHFDTLVRRAASATSRRSFLGLTLGGLLAALGLTDAAAKNGKRKKRKKRRKPVLNEFGCVDVGKACNGNDALCCSGICQGKKPKNGEKDKSRCVAHDTLGCTPERNNCVPGNPEVSLCNLPDPGGVCLTTTGNAGFCAVTEFDAELFCQPCRTDQDCVKIGFKPGSACINLAGCAEICPGTDNRACMPPSG
jgi:hypothetical protein